MSTYFLIRMKHICLRGHSAEGERVFHDGRAERAERGAFGDVLCDVLAVVGGRGRERFQRLGIVGPLQKIRVKSTKSSAAGYTTLSNSLWTGFLPSLFQLFILACVLFAHELHLGQDFHLLASQLILHCLVVGLFISHNIGAGPLTVSKILRLNT